MIPPVYHTPQPAARPSSAKIALPIGFSTCYKSVIGSRSATGGALQLKDALGKGKTQGTGIAETAITATKNQPTGAAVVPDEGDVP